MLCLTAKAKAGTHSPIGDWKTDAAGLPCFEYVGSVPYKATLDSAPWFVLGNYQLTLFTHVSGQYELITGQELLPANRKILS